MPFSQLIDVPLWNRARWKGVAFGSGSQNQPFMALVFSDRDAAARIFEGLRDVLGGPVDTFEMLRVAIIEGNIPGEDDGYTVHIGVNMDGVEKAMEAATEPPPDNAFLVSRIHRMPAPDSPHLAGFKREFTRHGQYLFLPAVFSATGDDVDAAPNLGILKTAVTFKQVTDIDKEDIDSVIFATERPERPH